MAYCSNCGAEISDDAIVCTKCGVQIKALSKSGSTSNVNDTGGFGWGLLGFCIPIAGLILYLVWKQERPLNSKAAGIGALIGFILNIITYIIYFVFFFEYIPYM